MTPSQPPRRGADVAALLTDQLRTMAGPLEGVEPIPYLTHLLGSVGAAGEASILVTRSR